MGKYCTNCGRELHTGARFCAKCGAAVLDVPVNPAPMAQPKSVPQPQPIAEAQPQKSIPPTAMPTQKNAAAPKRNGGRNTLCIVLSVLLVIQIAAVGLYGWPGLLVKNTTDADEMLGVSSIKPVSGDYKKEPVTLNVSYENYRAEFDNGIVVDFGQGCLQGEEQLSVRTLGEKTDGEYEAALYDFDMGKSDRFPRLAAITIPYDASWGENVFVQYYNNKTYEWEILWSEVNKTGSITFWTDHFSTFGVFKNMVESGDGSDGPLFSLIDTEPSMTSKCYLNYAVLAKQLRDSDVTVQSLAAGKADSFGTESMLNIVNNTGTFGSYDLSMADFIGGSANFGGLINALGNAGNIMTVGKIMLQAHRTGNLSKTLTDNGNDISQIILSGAGAAAGGTVATVLGAAALGLFVYGTTSSVKDYVDLMGAEDTTDYAYRLFTNNYVTYITKEERCSFKYSATLYQTLNQTWQSSERQLSTDVRGVGAWMMVLDDICKKYAKEPEKIFPTIEKLVDDYCTVFWRIQNSGNRAFQTFMNETNAGTLSFKKLADVYTVPSNQEKAMYTARYKAEIIAWMKPLVESYSEKAYIQTLKLALENALKLERELNEIISFTLIDEQHKDFSDSPYAAYPIRIRQYKYDKDWWKFIEKKQHSISCTRFIYMSAGMPKFVDIQKEGDELETITMRITDPHTYITFGGGDFPTFDELIGYYTDGRLTLTEIDLEGGILSFLENIGAEITAGDSVGTVVEKPFRIDKARENNGTIAFDDGSGGQVKYDPKTGKLGVNFKDIEGNRIKGELMCTYTGKKDGVALLGEIESSVALVSRVTFKMDGTRSLK